jgi:hypothetical protein
MQHPDDLLVGPHIAWGPDRSEMLPRYVAYGPWPKSEELGRSEDAGELEAAHPRARILDRWTGEYV